MSAEVDALNVKLQDVVKFIEGSNTTAAEVDEQLRVIAAWMRDNNLESVPSMMTAAEAKATELAANFDQRCRELAVGLEALQASTSATGASSGFQGAPFAECIRRPGLQARGPAAKAFLLKVEEMAPRP